MYFLLEASRLFRLYLLLLCYGLCHILLISSVAAQAANTKKEVKNRDTHQTGQQQTLSQLNRLFLQQILLEGNTVFTNQQLQSLLVPYLHRWITAEDVQELRRVLTNHYIQHGYINSGAVIPPQQVSDGRINIRIIEGQLSDMHITGLQRLRPSYLRKRLQHFLHEDKVFNLYALQQELRLLEQSALIDRLHGSIQPDTERGHARFKLQVEEARPWQVRLAFNNHASPNVGAQQIAFDFQHDNLLGFADRFTFTHQRTEGIKAYRTSYMLPLTAEDLSIWFAYSTNDAKVIIKPFDLLDITSQSESYEIGIQRPFYQTLHTDFELALALRKKTSTLYLLGERFSFTSSEEEGKTRISTLTFTQRWVQRSLSRVIAFYSDIYFGLDKWEASGPPEPDGSYTAWLGQLQILQNLAYRKSSLLLRANLHWSDSPLMSSEKFSMGGAASVRGYREGQITRDRGLFTSLEWRIPVAKWHIPQFSSSIEDGQITLVPFVDYAVGREYTGAASEPGAISSTGLGLIWDPASCCRMQVYWAHALTKIDPGNVEQDLQDSGIHFHLKINI